MNWVKKTALTLSISLLICAISFAQSDLRRAKKYIQLQNFETAITNLNRIVQAEPSNQEAHLALADAYRLSNRLPESHTAFSAAANIADLPVLANRTYGDVLMALNDYPGALEQYSLYGTEYAEDSRTLIEKCSYAIAHASDIPQFKVSEEYINTTKRDFGPAFFGEELVYLSNRTDMENNQDKLLNAHVNIELLKASKDNKGLLKYPKRIKSLTGQEFNVISVAYNPTLQMVAVTKGGQSDNINLTSEDKCTLYIGKFDRHGSIEKLKPYEFNRTDFSTGFASFSIDGMTMYFASDREGGSGGFDIYESKMVGGEWSAPINLGKEVNTVGNEITPSRTADMLLFASDARAGFGGFDMFKAYEGPSGFVNSENLGMGVNSSFDDYGMIYDANLNIGYLTSTRNQGKGLEDIYRVESIQPFSTQPVVSVSENKKILTEYEILKGMTVEMVSGLPLRNVKVSASTDNETTIITAKTNDKGMFSMPLVAGKYYNINFETEKFLTSSRTIKMETTRRMPLMKIEMETNQLVVQADQPIIKPVALGAVKQPSAQKKKSSPLTNPVFEAPIKVATTSPSVVASEMADRPIAETVHASNSTSMFVAPASDKVYAIQIAAISKNEKSTRFANVKDLGSLYTLFDSKVYKVRCGLFTDRAEAEDILRRIKVRGYETAFIVEEKPTDSTDLVMMDFSTYSSSIPETSSPAPQETAVTATINQQTSLPIATTYKVRLATYSNPKWFDQSKVEGDDFGFVEILMNEGKSIYMLSGFESLQDAQRAHKLAKGNGFIDAYVVKDENGRLSKIQ